MMTQPKEPGSFWNSSSNENRKFLEERRRTLHKLVGVSEAVQLGTLLGHLWTVVNRDGPIKKFSIGTVHTRSLSSGTFSAVHQDCATCCVCFRRGQSLTIQCTREGDLTAGIYILLYRLELSKWLNMIPIRTSAVQCWDSKRGSRDVFSVTDLPHMGWSSCWVSEKVKVQAV